VDYAVAEKRKPIKTDIVFNKSNNYVVFFVREGESSRVRKAADKGTDPDCNDETYFAYVIPSDELGNQCDGLSRGSMS